MDAEEAIWVPLASNFERLENRGLQQGLKFNEFDDMKFRLL